MRSLFIPILAVGLAGCFPDPVIVDRPEPADADGDGYVVGDDCDDGDPEVNPAAEEKCDEVDNDCDFLVDELNAVDAPTWYVDGDGDGFGDAGVTRKACSQPDDYVDNADDCNDSQATAFPGADEFCDGLDNDCDNEVDEEALDATTYHWDFDADGFGDPNRPVEACEPADWLVEDDSDCNDANAAIRPTAQEICDTVDNDCDEQVDDDDPSVDPSTYGMWYLDADGDGFGLADEDQMILACLGGEGYADNPDDCNDDNVELTTDCSEEI